MFKDHYEDDDAMDEDDSTQQNEDWSSVFNAETGEWLYKTVYKRTVSQDPDCLELKTHVNNRLRQVAYGGLLKVYPSTTTSCDCGVSCYQVLAKCFQLFNYNFN